MSLGALITKSRNAARLSIEDLSKATNIPTTLLRDMEADNFKKCGGETYARGHLRNIASKLGVDERVFLELFEFEVTAPAKPIRDLLSDNNVVLPYQEKKQISWKVLAAGSIVALIIFGVVQIIFSNNNSGGDLVITSTTTESATSAPVASPAPTTPTPTDSSVPITDGNLNVEVRATRGTSWLYVTDESGTSIFSGQIRKGSSKIFSENKEINLRVGNAGGVDIAVNGKDVGSIGADGQVVNLTYNAD